MFILYYIHTYIFVYYKLSNATIQHVLFGTVDELKFVGSFKRCLNTSVFPQLLRVLIELLQCTQDEPHY